MLKMSVYPRSWFQILNTKSKKCLKKIKIRFPTSYPVQTINSLEGKNKLTRIE